MVHGPQITRAGKCSIMCVCIHLGPTGGESAAESGVTYSSGDHNAAEVEVHGQHSCRRHSQPPKL
jgi:hypothetical protein